MVQCQRTLDSTVPLWLHMVLYLRVLQGCALASHFGMKKEVAAISVLLRVPMVGLGLDRARCYKTLPMHIWAN